MQLIETEADIKKGVRHLKKVEPRFAEAIKISGLPPLRRNPGGFEGLLKILVSQQLSVAAADGIWKRIQKAEKTTPDAILRARETTLRNCGLSRPKIRYARCIAEAVKDGSLNFKTCETASAEEATQMLTKITGVGTWTAEIYLMFCVGHADVFAPKDLALQESAKILLGLEERPTDKELAIIAEPWAPWRAVAARALWSYYRHAKGREGVT